MLRRLAELEARVAQLEALNRAKDARIKDLEQQLKAHSKNSHYPPSRDLFVKREPKPCFRRNRQRSNGGQVGHTGISLERVEKVDAVVKIREEQCRCGHNFKPSDSKLVESRQELDIPPVNLKVTEYQLYETECPKCHLITKGQFPEHIKSPVQYGPTLRTQCVLLNVDYKMPLEKIVQWMEDLIGVRINESSIVNWVNQLYRKCANTEDFIKRELLKSKVLHVDETGIKIAGQTYWNHVACNERYTLQYAHLKRGSKAWENNASILQNYKGILVHDCWSSYFKIDKARHSLCGAHLSREFTALVESDSRWAVEMKKLLIGLHEANKATNKRNRQAIYKKYDSIIRKGFKEEPPPIKAGLRGKAKNTKGYNLLLRLKKYREATLAYAFDPKIPFTNNQAERDIRHCKTKLKVSGCFRSTQGAQAYLRISSVISTLRKNGIHIFNEMIHAFQKTSYCLKLT